MNKSVVIIGKGESVLRCTKEFVDTFDEVAICNRPVYEGYEHLISNHADYDFVTNTESVKQYSEELKEKLGIKETILTGFNSQLRNNFNFKNLDPSTGILAFNYFLNKLEYTHICLVGFDLFQKFKKVYYFNATELNPSILYLIDSGKYTTNLIQNIDSGHDLNLTYEYLIESFKNFKGKNFSIISTYLFEEIDNLKIL
jgi:hypothetical protein